jgi:hypothetical protein
MGLHLRGSRPSLSHLVPQVHQIRCRTLMTAPVPRSSSRRATVQTNCHIQIATMPRRPNGRNRARQRTALLHQSAQRLLLRMLKVVILRNLQGWQRGEEMPQGPFLPPPSRILLTGMACSQRHRGDRLKRDSRRRVSAGALHRQRSTHILSIISNTGLHLLLGVVTLPTRVPLQPAAISLLPRR